MAPPFMPTLLVALLTLLIPATLLVSVMARNMLAVLGTISIFAAYYAITYSTHVGSDRSLSTVGIGLMAVGGLLFIVAKCFSADGRQPASAPMQAGGEAGSFRLVERIATIVSIVSGVAGIAAFIMSLSGGQ